MCISYQVSFSLSGLLLAGGAYCVRRARALDRSMSPLAMIPLLFGTQQLCEGWVWLGLARAWPAVTSVAATAFLLFALFVWPVWIPMSALTAERSRNKRRFLDVMLVLGAVTGLVLVAPVIAHPEWLHVERTRYSLHYRIAASPVVRAIPGLVWELLYLAAVTTPLLVTSRRWLVNAGVAIILAAAVARLYFDAAFASMWCLFAAALSLYLCFVFHQAQERQRHLATVH
ncbi:MAG: DUF6629 family protein [Acidobacteriota bacterium]